MKSDFLQRYVAYVPWILSIVVLLLAVFLAYGSIRPLYQYALDQELLQSTAGVGAFEKEIQSIFKKQEIEIFSISEDQEFSTLFQKVLEGDPIRKFSQKLNRVKELSNSDFTEVFDMEYEVILSSPYGVERSGEVFQDWPMIKKLNLANQISSLYIIENKLYALSSKYIFLKGKAIGIFILGKEISKGLVEEWSTRLTTDIILEFGTKKHSTLKENENLNISNIEENKAIMISHQNKSYAITSKNLSTISEEKIGKITFIRSMYPFFKSMETVKKNIIYLTFPLLLFCITIVFLIGRALASLSWQLKNAFDKLQFSFNSLQESNQTILKQIEDAVSIQKFSQDISNCHEAHEFERLLHQAHQDLLPHVSFTLKSNITEGLQDNLYDICTDSLWKKSIIIGKHSRHVAFLEFSKFSNLRDKTIIETIYSLAKMGYENIIYVLDFLESAEMEREILLAQTVGKSIMPESYPLGEKYGFDIQGYYQSASTLAGDWLGVYLDERHEILRMYIGDVTGHGVPSGLVATTVMATVETFEEELKRKEIRKDAFLPEEKFFSTLNKMVLKVGKGEYLMTFQAVEIDLKTQKATCYNMGHHPPFLFPILEENKVPPSLKQSFLREHGKFIMAKGNRLGQKEDSFHFDKMIFEINPFKALALYTDGMIEIRNTHGQEYGIQNLKYSFLKHSHKNGPSLLKGVVEDCYDFAGEQTQEDDISCIIFKTGHFFGKENSL